MANHYDKIIKENIAYFSIALAKKLLNLPIEEAKLVTLELQKTLDRRPDFVAEIMIGNTKDILHIEFQSTDDQFMFTRQGIYRNLLWEQKGYEYDVLQYVFFFGEKVPKGIKRTPKNQVRTYELIHIRKYSHHFFLKEPIPEINVFAIFADFGETSAEGVIEEILAQIVRLCAGDQGRLLKCINQLEILSQSRNLQETVIKIEKNMPFVFDITKDLRYLEGVEKGAIKKQRALISRYLERTLHLNEDPKKVAWMYDASIELVLEIRELLRRKRNGKR